LTWEKLDFKDPSPSLNVVLVLALPNAHPPQKMAAAGSI